MAIVIYENPPCSDILHKTLLTIDVNIDLYFAQGQIMITSFENSYGYVVPLNGVSTCVVLAGTWMGPAVVSTELIIRVHKGRGWSRELCNNDLEVGQACGC